MAEIPDKKLKYQENDCNTITNEKSEDILCTHVINEGNSLVANNLTNSMPNVVVSQQRPKLTFKNPKFSYIEAGGKKFIWKSLKQIVTQEKLLPWTEDAVLYSSLNAPPSLKPPKKYSDISGLEAPYTDPQTKLYYHSAEEFRVIRTLPSDIIQGYLSLRGATNIVG